MSNTTNDAMTVDWAARLAATLESKHITKTGKVYHLECANCGAEFDKADNEHISKAYADGDYRRKDGKFECDDCRPRYYHPQGFFGSGFHRDGLIEALIEEFECVGRYTIEECGGIITTITKENVDSFEVFYDSEHKRWRGYEASDIFDSLYPDVQAELWAFVLEDLTKLSSTHHVPDEDIAKIKRKIGRRKAGI